MLHHLYPCYYQNIHSTQFSLNEIDIKAMALTSPYDPYLYKLLRDHEFFFDYVHGFIV